MPETPTLAPSQDHERRFEILLESITDYAILMLDPDGRVGSWNKGAEQITGYRADEIIGRNFEIFYADADRAARIPQQLIARATSVGRAEAQGWRVRKDGSRFWASTVFNRIVDERGRLLGIAEVTRDITDRHLAQNLLDEAHDRMLQVQKMEAIGQLTGGVAHDFNNLLTVVIGNLEIIQRHLDSVSGGVTTRLKRAANSALRGAHRAAALTQRLLAFARHHTLDPKPVELKRFIAREVEFLQRSLGETILVEAVGGNAAGQIEVDANELEAALLNLAINARDAMPNGGTLRIETNDVVLDEDYCRANPEVRRGEYVLISVADNGVGMSRNVRERAFEPFYTTKAPGQGTGLGLSQVYGFVKQCQGHVKIYSEPGEGTTVKIYLPRRNGTGFGDQPVEPQGDLIEGLAGRTVLVVEDDEDVRSYLVETLRDLNYRVLRAADAIAALGFLQQQEIRIDLLLTDVVLPAMNGRELGRQAQALRPALKVLYVTGYSHNGLAKQAEAEPGVDVLQKPITQQLLSSRIRALLDGQPVSDGETGVC
jgi:PAS domain S-box-containing protein